MMLDALALVLTLTASTSAATSHSIPGAPRVTAGAAPAPGPVDFAADGSDAVDSDPASPFSRRAFLAIHRAPRSVVVDSAAVAGDSTYFGPRIGAGDEPIEIPPVEIVETGEWLRAPIGDNLLTDPARWRAEKFAPARFGPNLDYNRVDQLRFGGSVELQNPFTMAPRFGGRLEYATGRKRVLYGVQIEQPLARPGRLAIGASIVRRTDHSELQQVDDFENTLALLFGRQDYRDYFEREGAGVYVSWRVPDFSTVSLHARTDDFRSLVVNRGTRSWFQRDRTLRDNPAIDDGTERSLVLRFERLTQTTERTRAGLYHWIEVERAGAGLGGDFDFTRVLADLRSVLRLTPGTTLSLRAVGGHTASGELPRQRLFPLGGVDGLRAHVFSQYKGDELALGQAEYDMSLWRLRSGPLPAGLHALLFTDTGTAWTNDDHRWDVDRQTFQVDGGFGFASADDALRVYFAKNLRKLSSDFVISMRLQRPF